MCQKEHRHFPKIYEFAAANLLVHRELSNVGLFQTGPAVLHHISESSRCPVNVTTAKLSEVLKWLCGVAAAAYALSLGYQVKW